MIAEEKIDDQFAIEGGIARNLQERPKGYLFALLDQADAGLDQEVSSLFRGKFIAEVFQQRLSNKRPVGTVPDAVRGLV